MPLFDLPGSPGGSVRKEILGAFSPMQSAGGTLKGALFGGLTGAAIGGMVGGVPGMAAGAALGAAFGGLIAATKKLIDRWSKLGKFSEKLTRHFSDIDAGFAQMHAAWERLRFRLKREWATTLRPFMRQLNEFARAFTERWSRLGMRFFKAIEPLLEVVLDLLKSLEPVLYKFIEALIWVIEKLVALADLLFVSSEEVYEWLGIKPEEASAGQRVTANLVDYGSNIAWGALMGGAVGNLPGALIGAGAGAVKGLYDFFTRGAFDMQALMSAPGGFIAGAGSNVLNMLGMDRPFDAAVSMERQLAQSEEETLAQTINIYVGEEKRYDVATLDEAVSLVRNMQLQRTFRGEYA